jgi:dTDP-4-dehydrorhamnose reductase
MSKCTVLVFGANGQVGRALSEARLPEQLSVVGRNRAQTDITDAAAVRAAIDETAPAIVVNAAACAAAAAPLIHLSTDFVFDGTKTGAYVENDPVNPLSIYGQSKAAGEKAVIAVHPTSIILRTAWVYSPWRKNFLLTMLRLGAERDELGVVDDQRGSPTSARDIADALLVIAASLASGTTDNYGIFHYCGGGQTTWHGFATEIFALARAKGLPTPKQLRPIGTADYPTPAKRPANSVLSCEKIAQVYGLRPKPWQDSLAACLNEIAGQRP